MKPMLTTTIVFQLTEINMLEALDNQIEINGWCV